jgi:CubicO group peptidase (beta-lactamase class C family)
MTPDPAPSIVDLVLEPLAPLVESRHVPGVAVGLWKDGRSWVFGLGRVAGEGSNVPTGRTLFEIGSVSKVYTAILLAEMADRGEVTLDQPVQELLPDGVAVPSRSGKAITLRHLATHASGLPRLPDNLPLFNFRDPYAAYTTDGLYTFLKKHQLKRDPGEQAEYSNLGMGLLGHALACRAGVSYEDLVTERVTRPLGMVDTVRTLDPARASRLAAPHNGQGKPASNWEIRTLAGAGGLRSTVDDQLRFLAACLDPDPSTSLGRAIRASLQPQARLDEERRIGLGWILPASGGAWHNGQTGGYTAFLGLRGRAALVVLVNASTVALDDPAASLLDRLAT